MFVLGATLQLEGRLCGEEIRKWQSASGAFSLEAELLEVEEQKVQLKKADGTTLWVDLQKLCADDVRFIREWQRKKDAEQKQPVPKAGQGSPNSNPSSMNSPSTESTLPPKTTTSSSKRPAKKEAESTAFKANFAVNENLDLLAGSVSALELTVPATPSSFIGWHLRDNTGTRGYVADLSQGVVFPSFPVSKSIEGKALSPDGSLFATFGGVVTTISFYPAKSAQPGFEIQPSEFSSITSISFLSSNELIVMGRSQTSGGAIYDLSKRKIAKWLEVPTLQRKHLVSPDGKWIAVLVGQDTIGLIDTRTGKSRIGIKLEGNRNFAAPTVLAFSFCGDGRELGVLCTGDRCGFRIYDTKTGKLKVSHSLTQSIQQIAWFWEEYKGPAIESLPDDKGWLLYGVAVVDAKRGGPVWNQKGPAAAQMSIFQILQSDHSQIVLIGDSDGKTFKSMPFPWQEIEAGREVFGK